MGFGCTVQAKCSLLPHFFYSTKQVSYDEDDEAEEEKEGECSEKGYVFLLVDQLVLDLFAP